MKYYAQSTPRGCTTACMADRLCRFGSARERDAWVAQSRESVDEADRATRCPVSREEARRWYPEAFSTGASQGWRYARVGDYWEGEPDESGADWWSGSPTGGVYGGWC